MSPRPDRTLHNNAAHPKRHNNSHKWNEMKRTRLLISKTRTLCNSQWTLFLRWLSGPYQAQTMSLKMQRYVWIQDADVPRYFLLAWLFSACIWFWINALLKLTTNSIQRTGIRVFNDINVWFSNVSLQFVDDNCNFLIEHRDEWLYRLHMK